MARWPRSTTGSGPAVARAGLLHLSQDGDAASGVAVDAKIGGRDGTWCGRRPAGTHTPDQTQRHVRYRFVPRLPRHGVELSRRGSPSGSRSAETAPRRASRSFAPAPAPSGRAPRVGADRWAGGAGLSPMRLARVSCWADCWRGWRCWSCASSTARRRRSSHLAGRPALGIALALYAYSLLAHRRGSSPWRARALSRPDPCDRGWPRGETSSAQEAPSG